MPQYQNVPESASYKRTLDDAMDIDIEVPLPPTEGTIASEELTEEQYAAQRQLIPLRKIRVPIASLTSLLSQYFHGASSKDRQLVRHDPRVAGILRELQRTGTLPVEIAEMVRQKWGPMETPQTEAQITEIEDEDDSMDMDTVQEVPANYIESEEVSMD